MFKKILNFFKASFKSTPISTSTVVDEPSEIETKISIVEEPIEKKKRSRKKPKEETNVE